MECSTIPAKIIASCFAIAAFTASVLVGWTVGNPTETIIFRSTVTMLVCWIIGMAIGLLAQRVVDRNIEQFKLQNPIELDEQSEQALSEQTLSDENPQPELSDMKTSTTQSVSTQ